MKRLHLPALVALIVVANGCGESPESEPTAKATDQPAMVTSERVFSNRGGIPDDLDSPERALRMFLDNMVAGDIDSLKMISLANDDLDLLVANPLPPEQAAQARKQFQEVPIEQLKVGDTVSLPGGETLTVDDTMVNADSVMLTLQGNPIPFRLKRIEGGWKVDPETIISARKAAAK